MKLIICVSFILIISSCAFFKKEKVTYFANYCKIAPVELSEKSKKVVSLINRTKISENNNLYYCNCLGVKIPEKHKNHKEYCK